MEIDKKELPVKNVEEITFGCDVFGTNPDQLFGPLTIIMFSMKNKSSLVRRVDSKLRIKFATSDSCKTSF